MSASEAAAAALKKLMALTRNGAADAASLTVGTAGADDAGGPRDPGAASCPAESDALVHQLVFACLACEAGDAAAVEALAAVRGAFVDYNELRVASVADIVGVIGRRSVAAERRAMWVRAALRAVFDRANALTMDEVREGGKRGGRAALERLAPVPAYVTARVALHGLGAHAFPVDERLAAMLISHGVIAEGTGADHACGVVERLVRAGEAASLHLALEAAAASHAVAGKRGAVIGASVGRRPASTRAKTGAPRAAASERESSRSKTAGQRGA